MSCPKCDPKDLIVTVTPEKKVEESSTEEDGGGGLVAGLVIMLLMMIGMGAALMYVLVIKPRREILEDSKGIPHRVISTPHKEHTEFVDNTVSEHDGISYAKESIEIKRKVDKPEGIDDIDSIHDNDTKSLHNRTHFNSKLEMNTNDNDSLKFG